MDEGFVETVNLSLRAENRLNSIFLQKACHNEPIKKFYFQFKKQKKFCSRYKSNPDLGFLGYLPHMKEFMGNDDAFYEYRYDLYEKLGIS